MAHNFLDLGSSLDFVDLIFINIYLNFFSCYVLQLLKIVIKIEKKIIFINNKIRIKNILILRYNNVLKKKYE